MKPHQALAILPIALGVGNQIAQSQSFTPTTTSDSPAINQDVATLPFTGTFREVCKTDMLLMTAEPFSSIAALRSKYLIPDASMLAQHPELKTLTTPRIPEEEHVVTVTANLIAFKFEDHSKSPSGDNDFHVILGDSKDNAATLMNAEVSALPKAGDPGNKFEAVRHQFLAVIQQAGLKPRTAFQSPNQTIQLRVTGSLYFDADHKAGQVGPAGFRPTTVWEIHPIQKIEVVSGL